MIKRLWKVDSEDKLHQPDRDQVKTLIVDLMLKSPESIQRQVITQSRTVTLFEYLYGARGRFWIRFQSQKLRALLRARSDHWEILIFALRVQFPIYRM